MQHPLPFQQFADKYQVLSQLGRGASGICYHIITPKDQRHYALKKIPIHLIEPNKINAELRILREVQHPNIIRLQQSYLSKDFLYLLFDYNHECDLQKLIKQKEKKGHYFEQSSVWNFLRQILQALSYLHNLGILHRDIKPSNIFVNLVSGTLQVGDLGTAKISERQNYTRVGTPLYLAPQIIKYQSYTQKIDIWSLGITIYQMAALRAPFQHLNFIKLAQSITYEEPLYPSHFSARLKACIKEMLQKQAMHRPSAYELLQKYYKNPLLDVTPQDAKEVLSTKSINNNGKSLRSVQLEQQQLPLHSDRSQLEQPLQVWNVQLSRLFSKESQIQRIASKMTIHNRNSLQQHPSPPPRASSIKSIARRSSNRLTARQDQIKQHSNVFQRSQLEDGDDTIVLLVNPNDGSNFCGYYRQTPRPSRIHFAPAQASNTPFRMGRKSSLFKQPSEHADQQPSHFRTNHLLKQNKPASLKVDVNSHRRQESVIGTRQKHGELMSNLRPSRHGREEEEGREVDRPQLIVIDLKPLLLPCPEMI